MTDDRRGVEGSKTSPTGLPATFKARSESRRTRCCDRRRPSLRCVRAPLPLKCPSSPPVVPARLNDPRRGTRRRGAICTMARCHRRPCLRRRPRKRLSRESWSSAAHRDRLDDRAMEGNTGARWGAARLLVQRRHPAPGSPAQQEARERRNRRTGQVVLPRSPAPRVFPPDRGRGRADSGNRANRTVDALAFRSHPASLIRADPTELTIHCLYDEQQVKSGHHPNGSLFLSLHDQCRCIHFYDRC